jgi:hypothetical protein
MLFGKKKTEPPQPQKIDVPQAVEEIKLPKAEELSRTAEFSAPEEPKFEAREEVREARREGFPPLFVKLERYEDILNTMSEVKSVLKLLKNSFFVLNENEKLRTENTELIKEGINKIEKKINSLDTILLKPPGYEEMPTEEEVKTEEMSDVLSTLKQQVDQLKQEIESIE